MKKRDLFILLLFLWPVLIMGQQQVIHYPGYTAYWNPTTKIPDSVIWVTIPHEKSAKRMPHFHQTNDRPNLARDYRKSGMDIGHNCDASDENDSYDNEYNSFDFANTYPQTRGCNRITWRNLENHVRELAREYHIVKNKVYWRNISRYMGIDSVAVPEYCIKEIWYNGIHEKYVIPNNDTCTRHQYSFYMQ